ncbi:MAG: thioredoxin domain-containing protein, partial [Bdellovibrio sp.]
SYEDLTSCIKNPETMEGIRKMAKEGEVAQIRGTPTVFVNNRLLQSGQAIPVLEATYQSIIKTAK